MKMSKIVRSLASGRALAVLLAFTLVLTLAPAAVHAEELAPQAETTEVAVSETVTFTDAADAEKFDLYSSSNGGFAVQDGQLVPTGDGGEFKAIYKEDAIRISSVSVDIIPNGESGHINGGLYIKVSNPGNGQDAIDAIAIMVESNFVNNPEGTWVDAPNRVDIALHKFNQGWGGELHRLVSETGANNALFSGGVKQPLRLKVELNGNVATITLSLVSDLTKSVTTTYTYTGEGELTLGDVGLRSQFNDARYDNFAVTYMAASAPENPEDPTEPSEPADPTEPSEPEATEPETTEPAGPAVPNEPTVTKTVDFDGDADRKNFDFYSSTAGGFAIVDGKLVPTGESGEFKAIFNDYGGKIHSIAVDIYPGESGKINGGIYLGTFQVGPEIDNITALGSLIQSDFEGWEDAANRVDIIVGSFPVWTELSRTISETGNGNNLFTNGEKEPLRLKVDINSNIVTITLSLLSNPDVFVSTVYQYNGTDDLSLGDVGLRSFFNDASFDNFTVTYTVLADPTIPDTADSFLMIPVMTVMLLSVVAAVYVAVQMRKKETV